MLLKNKLQLILELSKKQIKSQYRNSFLGFLWTILNPLLNMLVMWFVFGNIFQYNDPYYPIYILCGNLMFGALRNATTQGLNSFEMNRGLLLRTKIELSTFPLSIVLSSLINFFFSLIALVPFMIWLSIAQKVNLFSYQLLFILLMLPAFILFQYGISLFLGTLFVFFKDIKHIYSVFLTLWTYATPLFYKISRFKEGNIFLKIMQFNPMYHFVNYFRDATYRGAIGIDLMDNNIGVFIPQFSTLGWLYLFGILSVICGYALYLPLKNKIITQL